MKKSLLLIPAFALILASCSSEEPSSSDLQKPDYAAATSYLTINLLPSNGMGMGTRADDNTPYSPGEDDPEDGLYEDGTSKENTVTRVRFYFFGAGGAPFAVRQNLTNDEYDNFVDWYPNSTEVGGPVHDETVEKTLTATLGLTFSDNSTKPAQVLAVANPTDEILYYVSNGNYPNMSTNSMSLGELQKVVANYLPYDNNNFVMSNSVYVANGNVVYTTALEDKNFQLTPADAAKKENIVTIYIERVLARVDFGISESLESTTIDGVEGTFYKVGTYTLNDGANGDDTEENAAIYVKLLGWNVTSTTDQSRLIKEVNKNWENEDIMGEESGLLWNTADYHRSFWAINPATVDYQFGNFGNVTGLPSITPEGQVANSLGISAKGKFTTTYLQENANPWTAENAEEIDAAAPSSPSKVIIAAQLVDAKGQPLTICEWGYNKYTLQGLKNQLAKALPNLYYETTTDDGEQAWKQIDANMITFTTTDPLVKDNFEDKEYYVYAVLDTKYLEGFMEENDMEGMTWALKSADGKFNEFTSQAGKPSIEDQVNLYIRGIVNHAMIWNSGLTYYFFDIRHLGEDDEAAGYVGIVRNHLYRTTVTGLKGLGTPVYDPSLEIHPEVTNPEETVIAAKINILSWRLVTSGYELNWE